MGGRWWLATGAPPHQTPEDRRKIHRPPRGLLCRCQKSGIDQAVD
ncbi:hypothetical protein A2U01_0100973, partial [Trifolium medium]|nr:hypothetical protein [Trifolium medium]